MTREERILARYREAWLDEYVTLDGYIIAYQISDPGQPGNRRGNPDNWEPAIGPSWEVVDIADEETGQQVTYEQVAEQWTCDEAEVLERINDAIEEDVDGTR